MGRMLCVKIYKLGELFTYFLIKDGHLKTSKCFCESLYLPFFPPGIQDTSIRLHNRRSGNCFSTGPLIVQIA